MRLLVVAATRPTPAVLAGLVEPARMLTGAEQARMGRLRRPGDRDDYLAAHLLVRACAADLVGASPDGMTVVQRCPTCGAAHGRPELLGRPGVHLSLAHSHGVVAAAAALVPVGIDVEALGAGPALEPADLAAVLAAGELALVAAARSPDVAARRLWARKEALLKAGAAELEDLAALDFSSAPVAEPLPGALRAVPFGEWAVHDWAAGGPGAGGPEAVGAVAVPAGVAVSLSRGQSGRTGS